MRDAMNLARIAAASTALLLVAPAARADDPAPAVDAPATNTVAAEPALQPQAPAASAVSSTKPALGFEVRLGGFSKGPMLGAALRLRTGFLQYALAFDGGGGSVGEGAPLVPGEPPRVEDGGFLFSAAGGWSGRIPTRTVAARGEVLLELGYGAGWVAEEFAPDDPRGSVERYRWFPMFGVRAGANFRVPRDEGRGQLFLGAAVFVRRPLATRPECVPTTRGCEAVGGWMTGLVLYAGAEGRLR